MKERKISVYVCDRCGKEFDSKEGCEIHERNCIETFESATTERLAEFLEGVARSCDLYARPAFTGVPTQTFKSAMKEAARRLREGQK